MPYYNVKLQFRVGVFSLKIVKGHFADKLSELNHSFVHT